MEHFVIAQTHRKKSSSSSESSSNKFLCKSEKKDILQFFHFPVFGTIQLHGNTLVLIIPTRTFSRSVVLQLCVAMFKGQTWTVTTLTSRTDETGLMYWSLDCLKNGLNIFVAVSFHTTFLYQYGAFEEKYYWNTYGQQNHLLCSSRVFYLTLTRTSCLIRSQKWTWTKWNQGFPGGPSTVKFPWSLPCSSHVTVWTVLFIGVQRTGSGSVETWRVRLSLDRRQQQYLLHSLLYERSPEDSRRPCTHTECCSIRSGWESVTASTSSGVV